MSGRKEERERLREERLAAQRRSEGSDRRRLFAGYAVAGLIVAAIVAGLVVVIAGGRDPDRPGTDSEGNEYPVLAYIQDASGAVPDGIETDGREGTVPPELGEGDLETAAMKAKCDLQLDLEEEGNTHLPDEDAAKVDYKTNPATSGDHYAGNETGSGALAGGAYLETPPVGRAVHGLEHGRVEFQYSPDLSEAEQLEIKGVFDESPASVILYPNPDMPYDVAATAWTQLVGCDTYEGAATLDVLRDFRDAYRGQGPEPFPING